MTTLATPLIEVNGSELYRYRVHPLAALFPEMSPTDFEKLTADISEHGQQDPIVLDTDHQTVLDGRHRLKACEKLGKIPKFVNFSKLATGYVADMTEAANAFIWSRNIVRRHLTDDQRAAIGLQWSDKIREAAKQRMRDGGRGLVIPPNPIHTREAVAAQSRVSSHKIRQAAAVAKHAPELLLRVAAGEATLKNAYATVQMQEPIDPTEQTQKKIFGHLAAAMDLATQRRIPVRVQPVIRKLRNYAEQLEALEKRNAATLADRVQDLAH
jgi:ParB-like nuclease domain